jgi:hypothetical protein
MPQNCSRPKGPVIALSGPSASARSDDPLGAPKSWPPRHYFRLRCTLFSLAMPHAGPQTKKEA